MGRFTKGFIEEWTKDITKEMSFVQDQPTIHGKRDIYSKQKSVCTTLKKQVGGDSKTITPQNSRRVQKFCRYGEFSECVLPRTTTTIKAYI